MAKSIWKKQASKLNLSSLYGIAVNGLPVVEELRQKARWNSAQAFLLSFPRGAYTTMLTTQDAHHVMAFERHLLRLASSLQAIRQAQDIAVDTHDYCSVSSLREPVILTVREAISNLERQICGFPSHVLEDYAVCVVVLVPLKGRQLVARASLATRSVASQHVLQAVYFSRKCPQAKDSLWVRYAKDCMLYCSMELSGCG